jgi:hypothetical protein
MSGHAQGGNDTLIGGNCYGTGQVTNDMVGDAFTLSGSAKGGNNTLYAGNEAFGGTVINDMWGAGQLTDSAQSSAPRIYEYTTWWPEAALSSATCAGHARRG